MFIRMVHVCHVLEFGVLSYLIYRLLRLRMACTSRRCCMARTAPYTHDYSSTVPVPNPTSPRLPVPSHVEWTWSGCLPTPAWLGRLFRVGRRCWGRWWPRFRWLHLRERLSCGRCRLFLWGCMSRGCSRVGRRNRLGSIGGRVGRRWWRRQCGGRSYYRWKRLCGSLSLSQNSYMTALISPLMTVPCQMLDSLPRNTSPNHYKRSFTCDGGVGGDEDVTDDDGAEVVQLHHGSCFGVLFWVFSDGFDSFCGGK